jgi:hypothetical protein
MNTDWQDCVLSDSKIHTNCGSYKIDKETCAFSTLKDDVSSQLKNLHATKITEAELISEPPV